MSNQNRIPVPLSIDEINNIIAALNAQPHPLAVHIKNEATAFMAAHNAEQEALAAQQALDDEAAAQQALEEAAAVAAQQAANTPNVDPAAQPAENAHIGQETLNAIQK